MTIKELFSDWDRWTQGDYAYDKDGVGCWWDSPDAVRWCLSGAIEKLYPEDGPDGPVRCKIYAAIDKIYPGLTTVEVNDERGYEAVMKVVEEAGV